MIARRYPAQFERHVRIVAGVAVLVIRDCHIDGIRALPLRDRKPRGVVDIHIQRIVFHIQRACRKAVFRERYELNTSVFVVNELRQVVFRQIVRYGGIVEIVFRIFGGKDSIHGRKARKYRRCHQHEQSKEQAQPVFDFFHTAPLKMIADWSNEMPITSALI